MVKTMATMSFVKTKIKTYPNGDKKIVVYDTPRVVYYGASYTRKVDDLTEKKVNVMSDEDLEKSKIQRIYAVRNKIIDYVLSNDFKYFVTLTQDTQIVGDRFDDEKALKNLYRFLNKARTFAKRKGIDFGYIFVPERHKNGAFHFHGCIYGYPYKVIDTGIVREGSIVYDFPDWVYGFTDITEIRDREKTASYIGKYLTDELMKQDLPKGSKKYWCSKGLTLPEVEYSEYEICKTIKPSWEREDKGIKIYNIKGDEEHGREI